MNWTAISAIGGLVQSAVVVASLWYVIVQLRQNTKAMIANSLQEILESAMGLISDYMRHGVDPHFIGDDAELSPEAADISICGRSAGGNLAAAMLLRVRDQSLPMPGSLVMLSPQVDLTESGDSFRTNELIDVVLPRSLMSNNLLYAGGAALDDPHLSPLFGDLRGFPPTFLQSGTRDLFLSNTVRMHRALRQAGVAAELHVFEAMPHGGFMGETPEDREIDEEIQRFVRTHREKP